MNTENKNDNRTNAAEKANPEIRGDRVDVTDAQRKQHTGEKGSDDRTEPGAKHDTSRR